MFRYISISGGQSMLSKVFHDRTERDQAADKELAELRKNSGLFDDNVLLLDNASEELEVKDIEWPNLGPDHPFNTPTQRDKV